MTSAFLLSVQISLWSAWQLGQLRLRQELLWKVAAVGADGDIAAKHPRLAGHDGGGRLALCRGRAERSSIVRPCVVKDLLDLKPVHGAHLPSCQKD